MVFLHCSTKKSFLFNRQKFKKYLNKNCICIRQTTTLPSDADSIRLLVNCFLFFLETFIYFRRYQLILNTKYKKKARTMRGRNLLSLALCLAIFASSSYQASHISRRVKRQARSNLQVKRPSSGTSVQSSRSSGTSGSRQASRGSGRTNLQVSSA